MARFGSNKMKMIRLRHALLASVAMLPIALGAPDVVAQQTTSGVRGNVSSAAGVPVAGARITITDSRTGRTTSVTTGSGGRFAVSGLEVGGPYIVVIDTDQYVDQRIPDLFLSISDTASLNITLQAAIAGAVEEIVVTGARTVTTQLAIGPSSSFGLETLENLPSISRDIRDTIRLDARVNIDPDNDDNISCLGGNNRFNSFTIDGVRTNDLFGLNASGFPSRNTMPIPFDAVRETAVEFSPFDVEYGAFTGCAINVVTKSGTNEIHGSGFVVYNDENLTGKTIGGNKVIADTDVFTNKNWGVELGGPIIKDKLFLYAAYEETKDTRAQDAGPVGADFASGEFITLADATRIQNILETSYGLDTFGIIRILPEESRRILVRADWFISDQHRLAVTYTRLRELFLEEDDFGFDGFAFGSNFENSGSEVETYSARLFSDWTENFSTEFRISRLDNFDIQNPLGGGEAQDAVPVPRIIVRGNQVFDSGTGGFGDIAISGPGFFRSSNALITQIDQIKAKAQYIAGTHTFTAGYELDQLDVFNLFVPNSVGTLNFNSIDDLEAGLASGFLFASTSFTQDINDAAASFSRAIHTLYVQDEWQATSDLTLTFGLRWDFFKSSDAPPSNPRFVERYGFDNTKSFEGLDLFLPRFGFSYDAPWNFHGTTTFRGGAGLFTGGDPTVWFSNAFTNFGSAVGSGTIFTPECSFGGGGTRQVLDANGNFTGAPQCLFDAAQAEAQANLGPVDAVDPNFKLPSIVRGSIGFTHFTDFDSSFLSDWSISMDIIHTRRRNAPDFIDLTLTPVGIAADGRPIFDRIDPLLPGCNAVFLGPRKGFSIPAGELAACADPDNDQDTLLTNVAGDKNGGSVTFSAQFNKQFVYDVFNKPATFDFTVGYAFTKSKDVNPTTSSTAGSNVEEVALSIVNNPPLANSQFTNRHNLTMAAIFRNDFYKDFTTTLGIFFQAREGRPFSFVFDDDTTEDFFGDSDDEARQLLYVPTGPNDPLADFSNIDADDLNAFFDFLQSSGLNKFAGEIAPRNVFRDPWFKNMDVRISQEIPTFWSGHRIELFVDIENFLNLLNDSGNVLKRFRRGDVGEGVPLAALDPAASLASGLFVFDSVNVAGFRRSTNASVWAIQFGFRYKF